MPTPLLVNFVGGSSGSWQVIRNTRVSGEGLGEVQRLRVIEGDTVEELPSGWVLRGVTSNERYVERGEREALVGRQRPLGRSEATFAALIPITKSLAWWELPQDERRAVLETSSHHIAVGLEYLPAVARRLHHGRDIGAEFDFLTWFEFAPQDAGKFEELVGRLRATVEWAYVDREVDVRLVREQ
jgi:hypothetical protein